MKYTIKYKTMGMTLCAGEISATNVDFIKAQATSLLARRHVKHLDAAEIVDSNGHTAAILNISAMIKYKHYEWLTIRN